MTFLSKAKIKNYTKSSWIAVLKTYLRLLGKINKNRFHKIVLKSGSYLDPSVQIIGAKNVLIGKNTVLSEDVWLNVNHRNNNIKRIKIGDNCHIGRRNFFSSGPLIHIKDYCFTGIDCQFLGAGHVIDSPMVPYIASGLTPGDTIEIGVNCWLTTSVTVMAGVKIGFGSVIGARSIVTNNIPAFSVAVGNPCKVIKRFDYKNERWVKVSEWTDKLEEQLPDEDEYLQLLKEKWKCLPLALIASGKRFGWV